jgi:hypothetical protein
MAFLRTTERKSFARSTALGLRHIFGSAVATPKTSPTLGTLCNTLLLFLHLLSYFPHRPYRCSLFLASFLPGFLRNSSLVERPVILAPSCRIRYL